MTFVEHGMPLLTAWDALASASPPDELPVAPPLATELATRARGGRIAIVVAASSPWVDSVIATARSVAPVDVWSPASWQIAARLARASARGATDKRYRADFAARWALDAWRARDLPDLGLVIAPSLAARHTFAAARAAGIATALLVDLPMLRALHHDLDAAASNDASRFLRRYRASARWVARQEAELVLADVVLCRNPYAAAATRKKAIVVAPASSPALRGGGDAVLLAGGATARAGMLLAAEACARAGRRLLARRCEGTDAEHANIDWLAGPPPPVAAVIAPARCEAHPLELYAAVRAGIPAFATEPAAITGVRVMSASVEAFARALTAL